MFINDSALQIGAILFSMAASLACDVRADCAFDLDFPSYAQPIIDGFQFEVDRRKTVKIARQIRSVKGNRIGLHAGENRLRLFAYKGDKYSGPSNELCVDVTQDFECSDCNAD